MDMQAYSKIIHNIVVPENLSWEERSKRYQPLAEFLQAETPEKLYRFRCCNKDSISAFDQDQIWFSPGYKMNDDFDALLYFDKETIKSRIKITLENEQFISAIQSFGQNRETSSPIQNIFPSEMLDAMQKSIALMNKSDLMVLLNQFYNFSANEIDINDDAIQQIIKKQTMVKFACFSNIIDSAAMWGYYAESSSGFALSYDFRNGQYIKCDSCVTKNQCPNYKNTILAPVIYGEDRFNATEYAIWLFQKAIMQKMLSERNLFPLYNLFQKMIPCSDIFMGTKVLLHKASVWSHEQEWRLICQCNSHQFVQEEFSCAEKKPTAVYLGQRISPIHEKILCHIAVEKNIPVYKMQIRQDAPLYKLYPERIS